MFGIVNTSIYVINIFDYEPRFLVHRFPCHSKIELIVKVNP